MPTGTPSQVQYGFSGWIAGTNNPSVTLAAPPTPGNVLVFLLFGMTFQASPFAYMPLPSGASLASGNPQANCISSTGATTQQIQIARRVVQPGDGQTWIAGAPPNSANPGVQASVGCSMQVYEFTGGTGWNVQADCETFVNSSPSPTPQSPPTVVTPGFYPAAVLTAATCFSGQGGDGVPTVNQADNLPTSGWGTIVPPINAYGNAGVPLYGTSLDDLCSVLVASGNASSAGLAYTAFVVGGLNNQACFAVVAVSAQFAPVSASNGNFFAFF